MSPLPFSEFLEVLRAKGLGVSLHEHLAVGKLLERWDATSREELRDAIAALVARHEGEVTAIRDLFDEFYPPPAAESAAAVVSRQEADRARDYRVIRLLRNRRAWWSVVALLALACAGALTFRYYSDPNLPPLPADPLVIAPGPRVPDPIADPVVPVVAPDPPAAEIDPPPSRINWPAVAGLSVSALLVSLVGFWGARLRAGARQWTLDAWQKALASLPGPYHAELVLKDLVTRLPRRDIEDAATLLARAFAGMGRSRELDVTQSLRSTLRSGLRPQLIFRPRRVQQTVLVLQDVSQMMRAHSARVEGFITDLRRQGVVLERWYFDGDVSRVSQRPDGPLVPLDVFARRREDWPLMVLSSGFGVAATLTLPTREWLDAFPKWTRRVWISPIRDPDLWPAALRRLPVDVLPMTRAGILRAATILAQGEYASPGMVDRVRETSTPVTIAHVERLKQFASVVPYPTMAELELLRQRFAPEIPERAVAHVADDIAAYTGAPIRMSDGDIHDHLHQLRMTAPALEVELRRYLLKILDDSEPAKGSAAHLRWEISKTIHHVQIAEQTSGDVRPALNELSALAKGPLWRELREAVERSAPEGRRTAEIRKAAGLQRPAIEPPLFQDGAGALNLEPFRWRLPRLQDAAVAAGIAMLVATGGSFTGAFRVQASHALDAYALDYVQTAGAGELRISLRDPGSTVPRRVQLYRGTEVVGSVIDVDPLLGSTVPLPPVSAPQVYQVRAPLADEAFALSNTLWAPSTLIIVDAQPWARVTARSSDGRIPAMTQTTPAAFRLPTGRYELSLENDGLTPPRTEQIQASPDGQRVFRYTMPTFDPAEAVKQLGVESPPAMRK